MGVIDDIENTDSYSVFPRKKIEERLKDLNAYHKAIKIDKDFQANIHKLYNVELLEEMEEYSRSFDKVMALGYALLATKEYKKWDYPGSAKARRIKAGVKHITNKAKGKDINNLIY